MRHYHRFFALLVCLALLLTACGAAGREASKDPSFPERHDRPEPTPEERAAETPLPAVTEEPQPCTEPPESQPAVRVEMTREDNGSRNEKVCVSGLDASDTTVWEREFATEYRTELTLIEEIGLWQDRYYLNHNGTVVCLNLADGTTKWENDEFHGASISSQIDPRNGNVYLCGYYGPDFFACDKEGQTLSQYPNAVEGYYWPNGMVFRGEDELIIYYDGGPGTMDIAMPYTVNLKDFSVSWNFATEDMDANRQYWANVFISDFVEQYITKFPEDNGSDFELARFAHLFCKINRHEEIKYENGCETLTLETVNELCQRFFGRTIDPEEGVLYTNDWGVEWKFENGKFYFPAGDGESYNRFAVVTQYLRLEGGDVTLSFDVYELGLEEYWDKGISDELYRMTAAEAEAMAKTGRITRVGSGTAEVLPIEQNGHDGYFLYRLETTFG